MSVVIDLDAARRERDAARAEAGGGPPTCILGGKTFQLPHEFSIGVIVALQREGDMVTAVERLFGPEQAPQVLAVDPTPQDLVALMEALASDMAGTTLGNSSGSSRSSRSTTKPSKRTSSASSR